MAEQTPPPTETTDAPTPVPASAPQAPEPTSTTDAPPSIDSAPKPEPAAAAVPLPTTPTGAEATAAPEVTPTTKTEPVEEPQNALTKKFTDAEWKALKEMRSNLSDIYAEAFPDKADAKTTPIKLWGVTLDPANVQDARVSVVLVKFLRARNLSVTEAKDMFISTLRWRDTFKPEEAGKEEFPKDVFGQLGHVYGHDKEGRPVTYNLYGANKDLKAVFGDVPRFIRWRVALMEKGVELLDFENVDQMVQVHDYEGVTMSSRDANSKNAASEATSIFSSHYPELLSKKFFVNVPTLMAWIFWVFKPLLSAQTIAKMSVVGSGSHSIGKALLPIIEPDQLPKRYGGKAEAF